MGHDIWLTNNRGTVNSKGHIQYSMESDEYWDFTLDQLVEFDVPAFTEFILEKSGKPQLIYIGHSQGTTQFFLANTLDEGNYGSKVKAFVGIAPVIYAGGGVTSAFIETLKMM